MKNLLEKYQWISYKIDFSKMDYRFWLTLGQCISKSRHISQIPLLPKNRDKLHSVFLAKGVAATTAIEGNTLGEEKVLEILQNRDNIEPSKQYQKQEVLNIIEACNQIAKDISGGDNLMVSTEFLCKLNERVLANGVPVAEGAAPGKIRRHSVVVGNIYRGPDAMDVPILLEEFCRWINTLGNEIEEKVGKESVAIIRAIVAHLYIVWIHPFGDGNGRTARLVEFMILLQYGIPSAAAHLLSNHYNLTRTMYYKYLDLAGKGGKPEEFFKYAVEGFKDGLQSVIDTIIDQVQFISWQHYVYETFKEMPKSDVSKRQRDVLIEISAKHYDVGRPLTLKEIEDFTAKVYLEHKKQSNSFKKDYRYLIENEFLLEMKDGITPNVKPVLQRLPFSNQ